MAVLAVRGVPSFMRCPCALPISRYHFALPKLTVLLLSQGSRRSEEVRVTIALLTTISTLNPLNTRASGYVCHIDVKDLREAAKTAVTQKAAFGASPTQSCRSSGTKHICKKV